MQLCARIISRLFSASNSPSGCHDARFLIELDATRLFKSTSHSAIGFTYTFRTVVGLRSTGTREPIVQFVPPSLRINVPGTKHISTLSWCDCLCNSCPSNGWFEIGVKLLLSHWPAEIGWKVMCICFSLHILGATPTMVSSINTIWVAILIGSFSKRSGEWSTRSRGMAGFGCIGAGVGDPPEPSANDRRSSAEKTLRTLFTWQKCFI